MGLEIGEIPRQPTGEHDRFEIVGRVLALELEDGPDGELSAKKLEIINDYGVDGWKVTTDEPRGELTDWFAGKALKTEVLVVLASAKGMAHFLAQRELEVQEDITDDRQPELV